MMMLIMMIFIMKFQNKQEMNLISLYLLVVDLLIDLLIGFCILRVCFRDILQNACFGFSPEIEVFKAYHVGVRQDTLHDGVYVSDMREDRRDEGVCPYALCVKRFKGVEPPFDGRSARLHIPAEAVVKGVEGYPHGQIGYLFQQVKVTENQVRFAQYLDVCAGIRNKLKHLAAFMVLRFIRVIWVGHGGEQYRLSGKVTGKLH